MTNNKQLIKKVWESRAFSDSDICAQFGCTHVELRAMLAQTGAIKRVCDITRECKSEINLMAVCGEETEHLPEELMTFRKSVKAAILGNFEPLQHVCNMNIDELVSYIHEQRALGKTNVEIAEDVGYTPSYIAYLAPTGKKRSRYVKTNHLDWEAILKEARYYSIREIARRYNISRSSIYHQAKKRGYEL